MTPRKVTYAMHARRHPLMEQMNYPEDTLYGIAAPINYDAVPSRPTHPTPKSKHFTAAHKKHGFGH